MKSDKDVISIGAKLTEMLCLECSEKESITKYCYKLGMDFITQIGHDEPRQLLKQMTFFESGLDILEFATNNMDKIKKTNAIMIIDCFDAKCVAVVYNKGVTENDSAMVKDLSAFTDKFILISGLESRRSRAGEDLMIKIMSRAAYKIPILLQAGCEYAGDYIMANQETIDKNKALYSRLGFKDVNDVIGCNNDSVVMLHCKENLYQKIISEKIITCRKTPCKGFFFML